MSFLTTKPVSTTAKTTTKSVSTTRPLTTTTTPETTVTDEVTTEADQEHTDPIASTPSATPFVTPSANVTTTQMVTTTQLVTTTQNVTPENDVINAECSWPESALTNEKWAVFQQEDVLSSESGRISVVHRFCPTVCDWVTSECLNYSRSDNFTCVTVTNRTVG